MGETGTGGFEERDSSVNRLSPLSRPLRVQMPRMLLHPGYGCRTSREPGAQVEQTAQPRPAHLRRAPVPAALPLQTNQEASQLAARRSSAGLRCLSLKVIPAAGSPRSLRRPAPRPILAPGWPGPAPQGPGWAQSPSFSRKRRSVVTGSQNAVFRGLHIVAEGHDT